MPQVTIGEHTVQVYKTNGGTILRGDAYPHFAVGSVRGFNDKEPPVIYDMLAKNAVTLNGDPSHFRVTFEDLMASSAPEVANIRTAFMEAIEAQKIDRLSSKGEINYHGCHVTFERLIGETRGVEYRITGSGSGRLHAFCRDHKIAVIQEEDGRANHSFRIPLASLTGLSGDSSHWKTGLLYALREGREPVRGLGL